MYTTNTFKDIYATKNDIDWTLLESVQSIIKTVQQQGDQALFDYSKQFDAVELTDLEVPSFTLKEAYESIDADLRKALEEAKANIETYQSSIKWKQGPSSELYQKIHPLNRVGIYVPGGTAPLVSTVLMTTVLANVAGVKETIIVTPPQADGIQKAILAACYIVEADHVYQVGGAQAVAALAYGTETIQKVDKIVGPGNQFVAMAKKLVYGDVGIDSIAGPSEIVVVVDESTRADWVAYDLLAQAEHDVQARTFLISESKEKIEEILAEVEKKAPLQSRAAIIAESLKQHHYSVHTASKEETIEVVNLIAGEHISIQTNDAESYIDLITTAGAIFIGDRSPEAIGDYVAGPSHVLPTGGNARFSNGLSVNDFLRTNSVIHLSQATFEEMAPSGVRLAEEEALQAHRDSLYYRMEDNLNDQN
ncbi:histidinol dehydrogenase [Marinilactibacillus sp. Marseille-P9653]|uniref:histidinol dehydrogenase n=1 Tax=Marinilactibacillus sp. Marseille-P9653 TaxID=2866583 RepID=UPI001CE43C2C|nr:histidinol dehydrogenase [Marinilactibacillus sp. Marseille-P9653]